MKELRTAESLKPPIDEQFILFCYKRIIEDEWAEGQDGSGVDYATAIAFDKHFKQCKANIEKCALLHYEFWNHLIEARPDIARLND